MTLLAELLSTVFERRYRAAAGSDDRPFEALIDDLMGASGEVSGLTVAGSLLERYAGWDATARADFFAHLAHEMTVEPDAVRVALAAYEAGQSRASYRALMRATEPPRQELIRRLNQVPGATQRLVAMREDLLRIGAEDDALQALDLDFRHLFASWFNRGFLVLRPISWESPAHILEKIIQYEAVHAIDSWEALRRRVEPIDRRCFAFFHPVMPDEPLIFVEVALTRGIPGSIQTLLTDGREVIAEADADTATFYSISNCQAGLAGISFGNSLIKQVAADLARDLPGLRTFVTLSPIPGLMSWLAEAGLSENASTPERLTALAAHYLIGVKGADGAPRDPVARFHLGNGAIVHKLHPDADSSEKGAAQSAGLMVNYLYDLNRVAANHERYVTEGAVAASAQLQSLSAAVEKERAKERV